MMMRMNEKGNIENSLIADNSNLKSQEFEKLNKFYIQTQQNRFGRLCDVNWEEIIKNGIKTGLDRIVNDVNWIQS